MRPRGPAWVRLGVHSAHPRHSRPLPSGLGLGPRERCYGWWSPEPGGSALRMGEPGCDWRGRQEAPVRYRSCGQRMIRQGGV